MSARPVFPVLFVLALGCFAGALSLRVVDPVVPDVARDLQSTAATVALLASAFAFPYAIGQPVLGPLADAVGKARIIKFCLLILAVTLLASAVAPTVEVLFALRVMSGFAAGGIIPVALAMVGDRFSMAERQVAITRIIFAAMLGQLSSSIGAGLIASLFGWRVVLAVAGAAALAALIATMVGLAPRPRAERSRLTVAGLRDGYSQVFANPRAVICYTAVFVEGLAVFGLTPYVAALFEERGLGGVREAGLVIAGIGLGGMIYTLLVRVLLKRLGGMYNLMRVGGVVAAAGLGVIAMQPPWTTQLPAFMVLGLGFFMMHNSLQTQATELAPRARGSAVALHAFFFFLGQAFGPVLYRLGLASVGVTATVLLSAAIAAALGFLAARALERIPSGLRPD